MDMAGMSDVFIVLPEKIGLIDTGSAPVMRWRL
jgi:hypothetical protein